MKTTILALLILAVGVIARADPRTFIDIFRDQERAQNANANDNDLRERLKQDMIRSMSEKDISVPLKGTIIQILDEGTLVRLSGDNSGKVYFVFGFGGGYFDGDSWSAKLYPAGGYRYVTPLGVRKTVEALAATKETAASHFVDWMCSKAEAK